MRKLELRVYINSRAQEDYWREVLRMLESKPPMLSTTPSLLRQCWGLDVRDVAPFKIDLVGSVNRNVDPPILEIVIRDNDGHLKPRVLGYVLQNFLRVFHDGHHSMLPDYRSFFSMEWQGIEECAGLMIVNRDEIIIRSTTQLRDHLVHDLSTKVAFQKG